MVRTKSTQSTVRPTRQRKPAGKAAKLRTTKQAMIIELLQRPRGASIADLTEATGWQAHSVRGAISGTLKKKCGLAVASTIEDGRGRVYRISDAA